MRSIKYLLFLGIMLTALVGGSAAMAAVNISLQANDTVTMPNTLDVVVHMSGADTVGSATVVVNFDKSLVALKKVTAGVSGVVGPSNPTAIQTANTNGFLTLAYSDLTGFSPATDTVFETLTFDTIKDGSAAFSINNGAGKTSITDPAFPPVDISFTVAGKTVTVSGAACDAVAAFTFTTVDLAATFDTTGSVGTLLFDYGDTQTGTSLTHTYATANTYTVKLTATGTGGCTKDAQKSVTVAPSVSSGVKVSINGPASTPVVSTPFDVTVNMLTVGNTALTVGSATIKVNFDKNLAQLTKVTAGVSGVVGPNNPTAIQTANTNGFLTLAYSDLTGFSPASDTVFATLTFSAGATAGDAVFSFNTAGSSMTSEAFPPVDLVGSYVGKTVAIGSGGNTAPVAQNGTLTTDVNVEKTGTLVATDADTTDTLTYSIVANGTKGTAAITDAATGAYKYTPNTDVTGQDTFTFKANDGTADSNTATVTVTISDVNVAPVAENGALTTVKNTEKAGKLAATDANAGDTLTFSIVANGTKGVATVTNAATGDYKYVPNTDAVGQDTFTFKANDGKADSEVKTVTVTIKAAFTLDITGKNDPRPLKDGLLIIRALFDFSGNVLIDGANDGTKTAEEIKDNIKNAALALDIDDNGAVRPLTDGLLVLRWLFGFRGDALINLAIGDNAQRTTAVQIEAYLQTLMP